MENQLERVCLCQYLSSLAAENGFSVEDLAAKSGKSVCDIEKILNGSIAPLLDDVISLVNILGMKITIQQSISFAHKKIATKMGHS